MKAQSLGHFLDRLASSDPTPGGGTAAAVAGAMAAGLLAMVSRLSIGKGGDDASLSRTLETMEAARAELMDLAIRDAEAFDAVMRAMRLPRATGEEKRSRQRAVQEALKEAADLPLAVAVQALSVLEAAPALATSGNPNAASDVGVGALLAHGAVHGALLNVRINLGALKDESYRVMATDRMHALAREADRLKDLALAAVSDRMAR